MWFRTSKHPIQLYPGWTNASDYKDTDKSFDTDTVALHSRPLHDALENQMNWRRSVPALWPVARQQIPCWLCWGQATIWQIKWLSKPAEDGELAKKKCSLCEQWAPDHMLKCTGRGGLAKCDLFDEEGNQRCGRCTLANLKDKSVPKTEGLNALTCVGATELAMLLTLTVNTIHLDMQVKWNRYRFGFTWSQLGSALQSYSNGSWTGSQ